MNLSAGAPLIPLSNAVHRFNQQLVYICLGTVIATVGLLAAAFLALRRRIDPVLLWFSSFALLYGTRLAVRHLPVWQLQAGPGHSARIVLGLGYLVPIPAFFFFRELGLLHRLGRIVTSALVPVLIALSIATLVVGPRSALDQINDSVITVALAIFVIDLFLKRGNASSDTRLIRNALLLFIGSALYETLTSFTRIPYVNIEPFAFLVLLAALGTVAARKTLAREQQLTVIQKELQIAQEIQRSILPTEFPPSRHFQVAACYKPMTAVAGDLYDYLLSSDDEACLLIGDVSGHGVPAALIASMVKLAATSQQASAAEPAEVLLRMNRTLYGNTQQQFVTAACAYLSATTRELRYAAAAHPPLLLLRDGAVMQVEENGLMLALFDFATYQTKSVPLSPGDRIVLYTDGLPEAENAAGEAFGSARLQSAVLVSSSRGVHQAAADIVAAVQQWSPTQSDDLTVLVCDYVAEGT